MSPPRPTAEDREREPFRWCVHCDADCDADEEHGPACPSSTNVFPVEIEASNRPCEFCGYYDDPPMLCSECKEPLYLGDHYTRRQLDDIGGTPCYTPICLGCAAQEAVES